MKKLLLTTAFLANSATIFAVSAPTAQDFNDLGNAATDIKNNGVAGGSKLAFQYVENRINTTKLELDTLFGQNFMVGTASKTNQLAINGYRDKESLKRRIMQFRTSGQDFISRAQNMRWLGNSIEGNELLKSTFLNLADKLEVVGAGLLSEEAANMQNEVMDLDKLFTDMLADTIKVSKYKDQKTGEFVSFTDEQALEYIAKHLERYESGDDRVDGNRFNQYLDLLPVDKKSEFVQVVKNKVSQLSKKAVDEKQS